METRLNCGRSKYLHFHINEVTRKEITLRNIPPAGTRAQLPSKTIRRLCSESLTSKESAGSLSNNPENQKKKRKHRVEQCEYLGEVKISTSLVNSQPQE
jgi:hypothetical protein